MSRRTFKERNSNRINFMILQEQAEEQLRREQEQAEARLQNNLDAMDCVERATVSAFEAIEKQVHCGNSNDSMEVGK